MRGRGAWLAAGLGVLVIAVLALIWLGETLPANRPAAAPNMAKAESSEATKNPVPPVRAPAEIDSRKATVVERSAAGVAVWPGAEEISKTLGRPDQSVREDLDAVRTVLSNYHSVFGEVPEGGLNEEITRGLVGDNAKKIAFLIPEPGQLNAAGALLDRWGTPYFFHKLSRNLIDLRSAGPDRKLFTEDDVFDESGGGPPL